MGGWMTYQRMRKRNSLLFRKPDNDSDPYFRIPEHLPGAVIGRNWPQVNYSMLLGDMNRMERGYLAPEVDDGRNVGARLESSPLHEVARDTGVDIETVRRVLRYVFEQQQ